MDSQIERTPSTQYSWLIGVDGILLVFLPAFLFIKIMSSWVGQNPIRNMIVIWVANIAMLAMVWTVMKLRNFTSGSPLKSSSSGKIKSIFW